MKDNADDYKHFQGKDVCPRCSRPYYYMPPPKEKKKGYFGLPIWGWAIIVIIIVIIALSIYAVVSLLPIFDPYEETRDFAFDVTIENGGHYRYTLEEYFYEEADIELEVTSELGMRFDVYIMDSDQYNGAYGWDNTSLQSFSSSHAWENVIKVSDSVSIHGIGGESLYLVIDNRDTPITQNDAVPEGLLTVHVEGSIEMFYDWD
ncbi:MAG: hypothetical protein JSV49_04585 [Thermoplasmata archaeon]|nr:MAG: hypothetical protein JSV49_04585 [Thermoplasmata archaeon]